MRRLDILVIDDEHDLASGIADMLELEGHRVALASSGEAALGLARERAFDMIFLDIKLPGMNGIDALRALRATQKTARVVVMTGYRIDNLLAAVAKSGGVAVLNKPFSAPQVVERLRCVGPGGLVLVAGDGEDLGASLRRCFAEEGLKADIAESVREALDKASANGLEVLVLDLHGPVLRALEACLVLQERVEGMATVVVARSPCHGTSNINPLRSLSVTGCLFKPFDPNDLVRVVRDHALNRAAPRQHIDGGRS
ncbi:MAG: response regulator [Gammaproteobacteria bacterium]|nr:response regulator [Gammaproteobacteria bacterium]